jgi:DNA-binding transcriptional LysR family regulator
MQRLEAERMFVAVMETGSFARAAQRLNTSSGQASKLVSRLEAELGARLLNRTTRALSPTEVGQAYFERIRQVIEDLDTLEEAVKNRSGTASGRLKLTAPLSFGMAQLSHVLVDFARAFPAITIDVSFSDRMVNLVDEGIDAAVRIGRSQDQNLVARRLSQSRIVVAASRSYLEARGTPGAPADLMAHDCIIDTNFRDRELWHFRKGGQLVSVTVPAKAYFSSPAASIAAAEAGLGIAQVPSFVAGPRIQAGVLVPLLAAFEPEPVPIQVMYPPGRHLAQKVRVLVDFLTERFRGEPPWDQGW